jgi:hypothetical protein
MDEASAPIQMPPVPTGPSAPMARARLSMTLIRPDGTEGGSHELRPGENKLGRSFGAVFENDGYLSPIHAQLDIRGPNAMVRDLESLNGVFVKMTQEEELTSGQIIRIGQELLRFELIAAPEPTADGTELMGSAIAARSVASAAISTSPTMATSRGCTPGSCCARAACSWPTSAARTARSSRSTASARSATNPTCCSASSCSG